MIDFSAITRRSKLLGYICRIPLNLIPKGTIVPILQGQLRGKKWVVSKSLHSFWLGSYEIDKQKKMGAFIKQGDIFYDIGANVGFYTLFASILVQDAGSVYAFEPIPENARLVREHIKINKLNNATFFELALSDFNGTTHFQEGETDGMGKIDSSGSLEVEVATLDHLVESKGLKPPTIMKIDVEGAEYSVLKGAAQILTTYKPRIFLATHGADIHEQCVAYLTELGYKLESLRSIDGGGELHAY